MRGPPAIRGDNPNVEVSALQGQGRGYVVMVNHGSEMQTVNITTTLTVHSLQRISASGAEAVASEHGTWKMQIAPYDGAIVEWK